MSKGSDPLAIRTHRAWRPYSYTRSNQRVADRQQMHGSHIQPMDQARSSRVWFWIQFGIYAACTAYALRLWILK